MKRVIVLLLTTMIVGCGSQKETQQQSTGSDATQAAAPAQSASAPSNDALRGQKEALLKEGMDLLNKADVPEAVKTFVALIKLDPRDSRGYMILAETYIRMQRYDEANSVLEALIKVDPQNAMAYYLKGMAYGFNHKLPEGIDAAEKSMALFKEKRDKANFEKAAALMQGLRELSDQKPANAASTVKPQDIVAPATKTE